MIETAPTRQERLRASMRALRAYAFFGSQKGLKLLTGNTGHIIQHLLYYPAVKDTATLADLVNRISCYLPHSVFSRPEVSILVDRDLLKTDLKDLVPPASQHNYVGQCENVRLVAARSAALSRADAIMLWNKRAVLGVPLLRRFTRVHMVDPTYYFLVEALTHAKIYAQTLESGTRKGFSELSRDNYRALLDSVANCDKGYVFGTGPSVERAFDFRFEDGFRIVSNSIVKNRALLRHIRPHVLTFTDPAFFLSPCRYAAEFRQMMLDVVEEFQCFVMVADFQMPLLVAHYPQLEQRIIGMPTPGVWEMSIPEIIRMLLTGPSKLPSPDRIPGHQEKYNFPTLDRFYVRRSFNIMTSLMIPVVSSVCKEIYFMGADGRPAPNKTYYSSYSPSSQLTDLMQTVFDTHPSVLSDGLHGQIYREHCKFFEELVRFGESLGRRYYTLTPSHIPALAQRLLGSDKI